MFIQEIYLTQWLKANILRGKPIDTIENELINKLRSFATKEEGLRELLLGTMFIKGCESVVGELVQRINERSDLPIYKKISFEILFNYLITRQAYQVAIEKVLEYENLYGESIYSLETKITALSAIDFESNESEIEELVVRRFEYAQ